MGEKRVQHVLKTRLRIAALVCVFGLLAGLTSCGGGGGRTAASTGIPSNPTAISPGASGIFVTPGVGIVYPPGLMPRFSNATRYEPLLNAWYIYDGTDDWTWYSAVGSTEGIAAVMSNPWEDVAVAFIPGSTGQVKFYIDGEATGTLDLSGSTPYEGYSDEFTTFYSVAEDMDETMHTIAMEIVSGKVQFDGWRIKYNDNYYRIDCSEVNTLEANAIATADTIRDAIEEYYQDESQYPNPSASTNVVDYLWGQGYFTTKPENVFNDNAIADTGTTYSGGDYDYTYSTGSYSLSMYGGRGTLYTLTPDSAKSEYLSIEIATPTNHMTTTSEWATFTVTPNSEYDATLGISGGLSGTQEFPATSSTPITANVKLKEGRNDIYVSLFDNYNHSINLKRTITLDTTAPNITLLTPYPQVWATDSTRIYVNVYSATTTVEVLVENSAVVTINGDIITESTKDKGVFSTVVSLEVGSNTITVTGTDIWGNKNETTFEIVRN